MSTKVQLQKRDTLCDYSRNAGHVFFFFFEFEESFFPRNKIKIFLIFHGNKLSLILSLFCCHTVYIIKYFLHVVQSFDSIRQT